MAGDRSREQSEYEVDGPSPQISFVPVSKSRLQEHFLVAETTRGALLPR